jgi:hypothetical protein
VAVVLVYLRLRVHWEQDLLVKVMTAARVAPVVHLHLAVVAAVARVADLVSMAAAQAQAAMVALAHPHLSPAPQ